jgi:D-inositol-3-phosphate glycosyltransferase
MTDPGSLTIAMISMHSSPVGRLGTADTGGMSVYIRELARHMGRRGHRVEIFTRTEPGAPPACGQTLSENVRLVSLPAGDGTLPKRALYPHVPAFFEALDRYRAAAGGRYDLVHSHYWLSGVAGERARRSWGIPHLTTFHTLGEMKVRICGPGAEPLERMRAERKLAAVCDRILLTSAREKANLLRFTSARAEAVEVVPCGVNLELFQPMPKREARRMIAAGTAAPILLFVGRIAPEKGLDRLIGALARLEHRTRPEVILVGGEGEADPGLRQMKEIARRSGVLERLRFVGRVEQAELPVFYNAADLLVLPSSYESFGMVALEALACGTPVVATPVGAMEELLNQGGNGRLARGFSVSALAGAIDAALRDRELQPASQEAVRRTSLRFSWDRVAAEVLRVYKRVLDCHAPDHFHLDGAACCGCGVYAAAGSGG